MADMHMKNVQHFSQRESNQSNNEIQLYTH